MCTLSVVKTTQGYIFTHNRDENINRPAAHAPTWHTIGRNKAWFCSDPQGGGTWMAANQNQCICLLNGGFEKHQSTGNYRHSRGLVPLAFFEYQSITEFLLDYNFYNLEPFTIILFAVNQELTKAVWDKEQLHTSILSKPNELFSSTTLYTPLMQEQRLISFSEFIDQKPAPSSQDLLHFHTQTNFNNEHNNLIMSRPSGVQTLGVMQFNYQFGSFNASYIDIRNKQTYDNTQS